MGNCQGLIPEAVPKIRGQLKKMGLCNYSKRTHTDSLEPIRLFV